MNHLCYFCLVVVMLSPLFIAALWSPERKGLICWLLFVMFTCFCYFPIWYLGTGVILDCLIPDPCCLSYFLETTRGSEVVWL